MPNPLPAVLTGIAALLLAGMSIAAAAPACGAFSLTGGAKVINVVDNAPQGKSPGDQRVGNRQLLDAAGQHVGDVHFVATQTAVGPDVLASVYFVAFADGWIATDSLYQLPDASDTSQKAGNAVLLVTGGTGAFAGASGTVTIEAGDPPTYVFDLKCGR